MIFLPARDNTADQLKVFERMKAYYPAECSQKTIMNHIFYNYVEGRTMMLTSTAFDICVENAIYEFMKFDLSNRFINSSIFVNMSRINKSPFYFDIQNKKMYISDCEIATLYVFNNDDFSKLFKTFY